MIKANELRIGNLFFDIEQRICKCEKITKENYSILSVKGGITSLPIKPIPLTEELLLKCGAIKIEYDYSIEYFVGYFKLRYIKKRNKYMFQARPTKNIEIKYLHKLQNIYFDLEETELEIKL